MEPIRVLVIDDSVVVRRFLTEALSEHPEIEVVGVAQNGRIGLQKIDQLQPDAVTLDIEMPVLSGLDTLPPLREKYPDLPVVMFSTLTEKGARATFEALTRGASTYVTKPSNTADIRESMNEIRETLGSKIVSLCGRDPVPQIRPRPQAAAPTERRVDGERPKPTRVDVVAIGVSTGGPNALAELFPMLPADLPVPIVLCQHMPPLFTKLLAERLDSTSQLTVREGECGPVLKPGEAWIAPGGKHMVLSRRGANVVLKTNEDPPENSCRPAVDPLFRSVHQLYGRHTLAVILTGMGQDGLASVGPLYDAGAQVIAQDEASSVVWGMPAAIARNGLADVVLPLNQIANEITKRCWAFRQKTPAQHNTEAPQR